MAPGTGVTVTDQNEGGHVCFEVGRAVVSLTALGSVDSHLAPTRPKTGSRTPPQGTPRRR